MFQELNLRLISNGPMLMHNGQSADPTNPYARAMREITLKRTNKTELDEVKLSKLKFMAGLYFDETGPYLPAQNVFRSLIEAGAMTRAGKKIERGVQIVQLKALLEYDGPRDIEGLWGDGNSKYVDRRMVAVNRVRIPAVRPIFPEWAAEFTAIVDQEVLSLAEFEAFARRAGQSIGVGDFRRFYGRFTVEIS